MWKQYIQKEMEEIVIKIKDCKTEVNVADITNKKVILYGAGIDGIKVFEELEKQKVDVIAFFDMRADLINNIKDVSVLMPGHDIVSESEKKDIPVILTVKPFKSRSDSIIKTLLGYGYKNIIKATDMFDFYGFTEKDISAFDAINSSIIKCAQLLEDEESYKIYKGFIASHATKQYDTFSPPTQNVKYFDSDFDENKGYQR